MVIRLTVFHRAFCASFRNFAYSLRSYKKISSLHKSSIANPTAMRAPIMEKAIFVSGSVTQITFS